MNWDNYLVINIKKLSYFDRVVLVSRLIRKLNRTNPHYAKRFWFANLNSNSLVAFYNGLDFKF